MSYYDPQPSDSQWTSNRSTSNMRETERRRRKTVDERPHPPGMNDTRTLDYKTDTLNRNAAEASPTQQIHRTVSAILVLVQNRMVDDKDSIQLAEYLFDMCESLKAATQGKNTDELSGSMRVGLKEIERLVCDIERAFGKWADDPYGEQDKEKAFDDKLEIQRILGVLNAPKSLLDDEGSLNAASPDPQRVVATSPSETACGRLIRRAFALHELPSLIETVFSGEGEGDTLHHLHRNDAQIFADVIDEALDWVVLQPHIRRRCLKSLYRVCGRHALVPMAMQIPVWYDRQGSALCRGGFADVWKGSYYGREVAVKVMRTYTESDLQKIIGRFCKEVVIWRTLRHPNVLPLLGVMMTEDRFAMISEWMNNGNVSDFVKANPNANRFELLAGVASGLIYIHSLEMTHGDLKGANILIDHAGHPRLADFGLLTIISDPSNLLPSSSYTQGGTARWMSPELIDPQRVGVDSNRPTKSSDCYALGMVIYETITGHLPFHKYPDPTVFVKVLEGKRPSREKGFVDGLWEILEKCWKPQPNARPSVEDVLRCLEQVSGPVNRDANRHTNIPLGPPVMHPGFLHPPARVGSTGPQLYGLPSSGGLVSTYGVPFPSTSGLYPIHSVAGTVSDTALPTLYGFRGPPQTLHYHNPQPSARYSSTPSPSPPIRDSDNSGTYDRQSTLLEPIQFDSANALYPSFTYSSLGSGLASTNLPGGSSASLFNTSPAYYGYYDRTTDYEGPGSDSYSRSSRYRRHPRHGST